MRVKTEHKINRFQYHEVDKGWICSIGYFKGNICGGIKKWIDDKENAAIQYMIKTIGL